MRPYVVRQGDYLASLARRLGFDADHVWKHPKNTDLAASRDPNILQPGDVLYLPASGGPRFLPLTARTTNSFVAKIATVDLEINLQDTNGRPMAGVRYRIPELEWEASTDAGGVARFSVPAHVREVSLVIPERDFATRLRVGHMDPSDGPDGILKRLECLAYLPPGDRDPQRIRDAVATYQRAHSLTVTGVVDSDTTASIRAEYGR